MARWTPADREHAYTLYEALGSINAVHEAMGKEQAKKGLRPPKWHTIDRWARMGKWGARRAKLQLRVEAKTEETLVEWRLRRVAQLDRGLDFLLKDETGKPLAALIAKSPNLVAKLIEVADRLRGGGLRHELTGEDGKPLRLVLDLGEETEES